MKKTSQEFMEFLGLKLGDRIKINGDDRIWVVSTERFMYRLECLNEEIVKPFGRLENMNFEILPQPKRVGDLKCNDEIKECKLKGKKCPFTPICIFVGETPYEKLKIWKESEYFDQEIYDLLKARLDKEVKDND